MKIVNVKERFKTFYDKKRENKKLTTLYRFSKNYVILGVDNGTSISSRIYYFSKLNDENS